MLNTYYHLLSLNTQTINPWQSRLSMGIKYHRADTQWLMLTTTFLDVFCPKPRSRVLTALPQGKLEPVPLFYKLFCWCFLISCAILQKQKKINTLVPKIVHPFFSGLELLFYLGISFSPQYYLYHFHNVFLQYKRQQMSTCSFEMNSSPAYSKYLFISHRSACTFSFSPFL